MNILIIEDDFILGENIKKTLEKKFLSNRIKVLSSYKAFLRELTIIKSYDIILIDIILWDKNSKNGIDIIKIIRREDKCIPIVIISWLDDVSWLEIWFNSWASDYLIKPFRLKEFEIRIYKWFKMYFYSDKSNNCDFINYNGLIYNLWENEFYFNNEKISLTKSNKYLLWIFLSNNEKKLSDRFLIEKIWWDIWFIIERNLRVVILRLKKSLKSYWIDNWIQNIRWEWYIFKKNWK